MATTERLQPVSIWRRGRLWLVGGVVIIGAVVSGSLLTRTGEPPGLVQVNGRIEGDLVMVAPKFGGRVAELFVREGDNVKAGQLLARLTEEIDTASLDEARAAAAAQQAQATALQTQLELLRTDTRVQLSGAQAGLAAAQAELHRAEAQTEQAGRDDERTKQLAASGVVAIQAVEHSALALRSSSEQQAAAQAALAQAQQTLRNAELGPQRIHAKADELAATRAEADAALARVRAAASRTDELGVSAPLSANVSNRYINAGEVVAAGAPLFGLTDLAHVYLKAYVPEPLIGRVQLGQRAQIWTDAFPQAPFEARVGYIASRAEFTPKEVQTRDDRTKLVYEVRLYPLTDSQGRLLPGEPADGMIRYDSGAPWQRPRN